MMDNWSTTQKYSQRFLFFIELICLTASRKKSVFDIDTKLNNYFLPAPDFRGTDPLLFFILPDIITMFEV